MSDRQHEFALFSEEFSHAVAHKQTMITLTDTASVHRLQHVLRLQKSEAVILFDNQVHAQCSLQEYAKNKAVLMIKEVKKNVPVLPELSVILPLLKREALDDVVYACRELGVTRIYLASTEKSSRHTIAQSELERLERVSIAAAEQSKNFAPCQIIGQGTLLSVSQILQSPALAQFEGHKLCADISGKRWSELFPEFEKTSKPFVICVGPEADLTATEKEFLRNNGFTFCQLGSTILRAQQATTVLIGIVRSLFFKI